MTAFKHYELLCDAPGCANTVNLGEVLAHVTRQRAAALGWESKVIQAVKGWQRARYVDFCPDHAGAGVAPPIAGTPLPAVCVDEVPLTVDALREIRDCLAERIRWFESRGRPVPEQTRRAAADVDEAIRYAAGDRP